MNHEVDNLPVLLLQLEQVPDDPSGLRIHSRSGFIQKNDPRFANEGNTQVDLSFHAT